MQQAGWRVTFEAAADLQGIVEPCVEEGSCIMSVHSIVGGENSAQLEIVVAAGGSCLPHAISQLAVSALVLLHLQLGTLPPGQGLSKVQLG